MKVRQIVVVNLPERADRRRETEAELCKARFPTVEFFPAIRPREVGDFGSVGERGAFLSHRAVLAKASPDSEILVLEDDVRFTIPYESLDRMMSALPSDWDFFYAGHDQLAERRTSFGRLGVISIGDDVEFIGAHCYAVRGHAIERLVSSLDTYLSRPRGHADGGPMPIDGAFNVARRQLGLKTFAVVPPVADQRSSRSDIAPLKWFDRTAVTRDMAGALRRIMNRR